MDRDLYGPGGQHGWMATERRRLDIGLLPARVDLEHPDGLHQSSPDVGRFTDRIVRVRRGEVVVEQYDAGHGEDHRRSGCRSGRVHVQGGVEIMIVTIENWSEVEHDLQTNGIADAEYDGSGTLTAIMARSGQRYEVSKDLFVELQLRGLVMFALGGRVDRREGDA